MDICILAPEEQERFYPEVLEMLQEADGEFVPPLSCRNSATQQNLAAAACQKDGVQRYFADMVCQRFAIALEKDSVIGFVSYKENYSAAHVAQIPNIYISTVIVRPCARGRGVTTAMYKKLFSHYPDRYVFTRTWSGNIAHVRVLEKLGFAASAVVPNHRGEGIHTVYFGKDP